MHPRFPVLAVAAVVALGAAFVILAPGTDELARDLSDLSKDLANGTWSPFGQEVFGKDPAAGHEARKTQAGGITGQSAPDFTPAADALPDTWRMDRANLGGDVVIRYVFDPALGAMKRLKAFDDLSDDGLLRVRDEGLRAEPVRANRLPDRSETLFKGRFEVRFTAGTAVPVYSPHPDAVVTRLEASGVGEIALLKDGADTFYVRAARSGVTNLTIWYVAEERYYSEIAFPRGPMPGDYSPAQRPANVAVDAARARVVLQAAGVPETSDVAGIARGLAKYFRDFEDGPIPGPGEYSDIYDALSLGRNGCCRHRAYAYALTLQAIGIPARVIVNEAHAFAEVQAPDGAWFQFNLGGCGSYSVANPDGNNEYRGREARDPRTDDRTPGRPGRQSHTVEITITEYTETVSKPANYSARGTIFAANGQPVPGAPVDLFLNRTKDQPPGIPIGSGRTTNSGEFVIEGRIPDSLPAGRWNLVARSARVERTDVVYLPGWSDPAINVTSDTRFDVVIPPKQEADALGFVTGAVREVGGVAVVGALVDVYVDGVNVASYTSDATGRFEIAFQTGAIGVHDIRLDYAGDEWRSKASHSATFEAVNAALEVPARIVLVAGSTFVLEGRALADGKPLAYTEIDIGFGRLPVTVTDPAAGSTPGIVLKSGANGEFRVAWRVDATRPLTGVVTVTSPSTGVSRTLPVSVLIRPVIDVSLPPEIADGGAGDVIVRVTDNAGRPLPNMRVTLILGSSRPEDTTNATGVVSLPVAGLGRGEHLVSVLVHARYPDFSDASATSKLRVGTAFNGGILPVVGVAVAAPALLIAAVIVTRRRGASTAVAAVARRALAGVHVDVALPSLDRRVPDVWGPAAEGMIAVTVTKRGRGTRAASLGGGLARAIVNVRVDGAHHRVVTDSVGVARVPIQFDSLGERAIEIRVKGRLRRTRARAHHVLRVVPWSQAIEEGWLDLLALAREHDIATADANGPQENAAILARAIPTSVHGDLASCARAFELTNYGRRETGFEVYRLFTVHKAAVVAALTAGGAP